MLRLHRGSESSILSGSTKEFMSDPAGYIWLWDQHFSEEQKRKYPCLYFGCEYKDLSYSERLHVCLKWDII